MEQLFRQFFDHLQSNHNSSATTPPTAPKAANAESVDAPAVTAEPGAPSPIAGTSPVEQVARVATTQPLFGKAVAEPPVLNSFSPESDFCASGNQSTQNSHSPERHDVGKRTQRHDDDGYEDLERSRRYADGFGELDVDSNGQLRYVGLGSTASVAVENCMGLRRYITKGLEQRGFESEDSFLASPEATCVEEKAALRYTPREDPELLPSVALVDALIAMFVEHLAHIFPIVSNIKIQDTYRRMLSHDHWDAGHAATLFSLCAVATPLLPAEHVVFGELGSRENPATLGAKFFNRAMHHVNMGCRGKKQRKDSSQDMVVSLGLLSVYLAETGSQAEAWILVGRAIRMAQDIGLHRSPEKLRLSVREWDDRRCIWWCLYILERQLCTGKRNHVLPLIKTLTPLSIGPPSLHQ